MSEKHAVKKENLFSLYKKKRNDVLCKIKNREAIILGIFSNPLSQI